MTNIRNGNTCYVDGTTPTLQIKNILVRYVLVTATSANAVLVLKDVSTGNVKMDLRVAASGTTQQFWFDEVPVLFPNGIEAATVTNCVATIVIEESRK